MNYQKRMLNYYPLVIQDVEEYQALIGSESVSVDQYNSDMSKVQDDAYLYTMDEERIVQWEKALGISPLEDESLQDRRETIVGIIRGSGKLNTASIASIVNAFTNGTATSYFEDSVIYVEISPPPNNKQYRFENVENALKPRVPAHLGLSVARNYATWGEIKTAFTDWNAIKTSFETWEDVLLYVANKSTRKGK